MKIRAKLAFVATSFLIGSAVYAENYSVDVWADNWFQLNVDGVIVAEDSVPITTERSFNAESFTFDAEPPFTLGLIAKDFKEMIPVLNILVQEDNRWVMVGSFYKFATVKKKQ